MRVITGSARGVRLNTPAGRETRPTTERVKEALFSAIQFEIEGRRVLDLFSGSGQLGIEALSRGASYGVFVDAAKDAAALTRENLKRAGFADQSTVLQTDSIAYLSRCREKFGLIFLDPPYAETLLETALERIIAFDILSSGGIIVAERPEGKELPGEFAGYTRSRDYRYGTTLITFFRKQ